MKEEQRILLERAMKDGEMMATISSLLGGFK
jgi:hypothetical protein